MRLAWIMCWVFLLGVVACASPPPAVVVEDAEGVEPVSGLSASCSKPFPVERDSSIMSGSTREIEIEGVEIKVAGSEDGRHVLMMPPKLGTQAVTNESNRRYQIVKATLAAEGVGVRSVVPMVQSGLVMGYYLELDGDGYAVLLGFSS